VFEILNIYIDSYPKILNNPY